MGKIIAAIFGLISLVSLLFFIHLYNSQVDLENDILKEDEQSFVVITSTTNQVMSLLSIKKEDYKAFEEIIKANMIGRNGADGNQAMMQMVREHNLTPDQSAIKKMTQIVSSGAEELKMHQSKLNDMLTANNKRYDYLVTGYLLKKMDFPKKDLSQVKLLMSNEALEAKETRILKPMNAQ